MKGSCNRFAAIVQAHNKALKLSQCQSKSRDRCYQEDRFRSNPFEFARRICGRPSDEVKPTFSPDQCLDFFQKEYSRNNCKYQDLPNWVREFYSKHVIKNSLIEFSMAVITPQLVKRALRKCSSNSRPGANGLTYKHLKHLPSVHHVLATLYTKILLTKPVCPNSWCVGKIILIHKAGSNSNPKTSDPSQ